MTFRPNVLFIVVDDLNGWIGALDRHPDVRTPNIDALAAEGVLFTHTYCTAPHCNPSRASVFTGLRPSTTGIYHGEELGSRDTRPWTLPEVLRSTGYSTFGTGKVLHGSYDYARAKMAFSPRAQWSDTHNDLDLWDEFVECPDEPIPVGRPLNRLSDPLAGGQELQWFSHFDWGPMQFAPDARLPDEEVCERAKEYLHRSHKAPFFCAVGLYRPHLPWYVPQHYFDLYPLDSVTLPAVQSDCLSNVPPIPKRWVDQIPDHERILQHGQWRHAVQAYLASVSFCDEMVGRLLSALQSSGHADDTLVVLWSDNGFHLGEKLHWRKFTLWEEATRVPLVIRAPDGAVGHRTEHPVSLLDLFPSIVELCGVDVPDGLEGRSLARSVAGLPAEDHPLPLATWGAGNHSIRSARWRYTLYSDGEEELYDHSNDPYEWTNLASRSQHDAVKRTLRPAIEALLEQESAARRN